MCVCLCSGEIKRGSKDRYNIFLRLIVSLLDSSVGSKKLYIAVHQSAPTSPSPLGLSTVEVICTVI